MILAAIPGASRVALGILRSIDVAAWQTLVEYEVYATAAIVGMVVPVAVLAVSALSASVGSRLIVLIIRRFGNPLSPLMLGVPLLAILVAYGAVLRAQGVNSGVVVFGSLAILVLFFTQVLLVLRLLWIVMRSIDSRWVFSRVKQELAEAARQDLYGEAHDRVVDDMHQTLLDFRRTAFSSDPTEDSALPILSRGAGYVWDFLLYAAAPGAGLQRPKLTLKWAVAPRQEVGSGDELALMIGEGVSRFGLWLARRLVRSICILRRRSRQESRIATDFLASLKDLAIQKLQGGGDSQLQEALDVFEAVSESYLALARESGLRFKQEHLRSAFSEFMLTRALRMELNDVIEAAVQQPRREHVSTVSETIRRIMSLALKHRDLRVVDVAVNLSVFLYWAAAQSSSAGSSALAKHRARYTLANAVDWELLRLLEKTSDPQAAEEYVNALLIILGGMEALLYHVLEGRDNECLEDVCRSIQEFLENWHVHPPRLSADESRAAPIREGMPSRVAQAIAGVWLAAGCYLIERVARNAQPDEFDVQALRRMKEKFPDPGLLVKAVANRLRHPPHWEIWEEVEDTKRVRWSDDRQRCAAFYLVRVVELIQEGKPLPAELPQELLFAVDLFRPIAERLLPKEGAWAKPAPSEEDVESAIVLHEQSRRDSEAANRLLVRAADIPDSSIAALLGGFEDEYRIESGILGFLATALGPGCAEQGDRHLDIERIALLPKKPFVRPELGGDVSVAKILGADLGRDWKRVEEHEITAQLERAAAGSSGSGTGDGSIPSIRDSILAMKNADRPPDLLVLSRDLWVELLRSGSYVPTPKDSDEGHGFRGRLDGVPVFFRPIDSRGLLVFLDPPHSRVAFSSPVLETSSGDDIVVSVRNRHGEVEEEAGLRVTIRQELELHLSDDSEVRSV